MKLAHNIAYRYLCYLLWITNKSTLKQWVRKGISISTSVHLRRSWWVVRRLQILSRHAHIVTFTTRASSRVHMLLLLLLSPHIHKLRQGCCCKPTGLNPHNLSGSPSPTTCCSCRPAAGLPLPHVCSSLSLLLARISIQSWVARRSTRRPLPFLFHLAQWCEPSTGSAINRCMHIGALLG